MLRVFMVKNSFDRGSFTIKKVMYHMFVMKNSFSLKFKLEDLIFLTREINAGVFLKN